MTTRTASPTGAPPGTSMLFGPLKSLAAASPASGAGLTPDLVTPSGDYPAPFDDVESDGGGEDGLDVDTDGIEDTVDGRPLELVGAGATS